MRLVTVGAWAQFTLLLPASTTLVFCFSTGDLSVIYVAQHSCSLLSWGLKLAAMWGGHEGPLLLWVLFLSGWGVLFVLHYRRDIDALLPPTLSVLLIITAPPLLFVVVWSDSLVRIFPPATEGRDFNLILQHPGSILRPPLLYLGYDGLTVAAGVALASLPCGDFSAQSAWACWCQVLSGWYALTLGIILGSWWAYCELGWDGWRFWGLTENASLLPWFSVSALLHSLYIARQHGIFRHWSLLLAIVTLILSLLGTLIVRSGTLVSVHAFALNNARVTSLFALFTMLSLASFGLYAWRGQQVRQNACFGGRSREVPVLVVLLLSSAVPLVVLIGTLYPMIYGLFGWGRFLVDAPYFNRATLPFGLLMLLIIVLVTVRSHNVSFRIQLSALLARVGVLASMAGIVFSNDSRQEISPNPSPGQQAELAGYIFRFECLDLEAKGNYTSEKAQIALWHNEKRIDSL